MAGMLEDFVKGQLEALAAAMRQEIKDKLPSQFADLFKAFAERLQALEEENDEFRERLETTQKALQGVTQANAITIQTLQRIEEQIHVIEALQTKIGRLIDEGNKPAEPAPAPPPAKADLSVLLPPRKGRAAKKQDASACTQCGEKSSALAVKANGARLCQGCNSKVARA